MIVSTNLCDLYMHVTKLGKIDHNEDNNSE